MSTDTGIQDEMSSTSNIVRHVEAGRLVYYLTTATPEFWDEWSLKNLSEASYESAKAGNIKPFDGVLNHYIPKFGKILEAGCGDSKIVVSLLAAGYDVEGVEWGKQTVETVLSYFPDLPIRSGDVTALNVPDCQYTGYLSLGVVEHRREGPEPFLSEAYRVLAPGGVALISVPYFNPLRKLKSRLGFYREKVGEQTFYQYAYSKKEFIDYIKSAGFDVLDWGAYSGVKGLKDELPLMSYVYSLPYIGRRLRKILYFSHYVNKFLGHMIVVACKKPETT